MTTRVNKWGNSYGIRVPKEYMERMGLAEGDTVHVAADAESLIVTKEGAKTIHSLQERLEKFYGKPIDEIFVDGSV